MADARSDTTPGQNEIPADPHTGLPRRRLKPDTSPVGCICPPGANLKCERPDCPRKDHLTMGQRLRNANG